MRTYENGDLLKENYQNDLHKKIIETTQEGFWLIDKNKLTIEVNDALCKMLGYAEEEILGLNPLTFLNEENKSIMKQQMSQVNNTKHRKYQISLTRKDGSQISTIFNAASIHDPDGNPDGSFAFVTDITEITSIQTDLIASKEKYQTIFERSTDTILIINNSVFIDCNEAAWKGMKFQCKDDIIGKRPWEISPEYQPDGANSKDMALVQFNKALDLGYNRFEWVHLNGEEEEVWVDIALTHIPEKGKSYIHALWRDISKSKKTEKAHLDIDNRYKMLTEITIEGIFVHDNNTIKDVNPAAAEMLHYDSKKLIGKNILDVIHPDYHKIVKERISKNIEGAYELEMLCRDGSTLFAEAEAKYALIGGNEFRVVAIRDRTEQRNAQKALQESEDKFKILTDTAPWAVLIYQNDKWVYSNEAGSKISGYSQSELLKMNYWDFIHPDYVDIVKKRSKGRIDGHNPISRYEFIIITKTGEEKWVDLSGGITSFNGNPAGIVTVNDISDRKNIENELKESEKRFKFLSNVAFEGIIIHEKGIVKDVNESFLKMVGYSREETIGANLLDYIPGVKDRANVLKNLLLKKAKPYTISTKHKNGRIFRLGIESRNIKYKGKVVRIAAVRDVTEKEKAEQLIIESKNRLKQIIHGSSIATFVLNKDYKVTHWNKACENITGIKADDVVGTSDQWKGFYKTKRLTMADIMLANNSRELVENYYSGKYSQSKLINGSFEAEDFFPNMGENGLWLIFTAAPIKDSKGNIIGAIETLHDITSRKQSEEKIQSLLTEKEIVLREVHHRIKNNMATIESLLRLHSKRTENNEVIYNLMDAGNRIKSMRILYDKLLASDNFSDVFTLDYLQPLISEMIDIFPNKDKIKVIKQIDDFKISAKLVFPLGIIINELITNIMKYAFKDDVNNIVTISATKKDGKALIAVQDNGIGIPEEIDLKTTRSFGLKLVEMLIGQIDGTIEIIRENGTKFVLEFDL